MFCENCGSEIPDDSVFCPVCGHKIDDPVQLGPAPVYEEPVRKKKPLRWPIYVAIIAAAFLVGSIIAYQNQHLQSGTSSSAGENMPQGNGTAGLIKTESSDQATGNDDSSGTHRKSSDKSDTENAAPKSENTPTLLPTETPTPTPEPTHRYEAYVEDVSWQEAFDRAKEKGGRLAIIRNADEWDKVTAALDRVGNTKVNFYISGGRDSSRIYHWIDEDMYFMDGNLTQDAALTGHWYSGEPSYEDHVTVSGQTLTIEENCLTILTPSGGSEWYLNDASSDILKAYPSSFNFSGKIGYVVEFDE